MIFDHKIIAPKKFRSSRWNDMKVKIIEDQGTHFMTVNRNGRRLRFYKKWVFKI